MKIAPDIDGISIVVVGPMNPPIFQPRWLEKVRLVEEADVEDCIVEIIHNDISILKFPNFSIQVQSERFWITSQRQPFEETVDLVLNLFGNILIHVPVKMMGINRDVHFAADIEAKDRIGNLLAPKEPWGELGKSVAKSMDTRAKETHGGLTSITLEDRWVEDGQKRRFRVKLEPSNKIQGIYMNTNDHFDLNPEEENFPAQQVASVLSKHWEPSMARAEQVINTIMELA